MSDDEASELKRLRIEVKILREENLIREGEMDLLRLQLQRFGERLSRIEVDFNRFTPTPRLIKISKEGE